MRGWQNELNHQSLLNRRATDGAYVLSLFYSISHDDITNSLFFFEKDNEICGKGFKIISLTGKNIFVLQYD